MPQVSEVPKQDTIQAVFDRLGLSTEEDRRRFRNYGRPIEDQAMPGSAINSDFASAPNQSQGDADA